jgi:SAM-dependent methyltransferase
MDKQDWGYDQIADIYETDMGRSMPFDDVAWYVSSAQNLGGRALELGCGTGRILLPLIRAGIDVIGIDRSRPMLAKLKRDAHREGLQPSILQMDISRLGITGRFRCIILAYSLITYLHDEVVAGQVLRSLGERLEPGGMIILDAFIPRPIQQYAEFTFDYRREYGDGALERSKRITVLPCGRHRIERRYVIRNKQELAVQTIETNETIRPYTVKELVALGMRGGLAIDNVTFDYHAQNPTDGARFATMALRQA